MTRSYVIRWLLTSLWLSSEMWAHMSFESELLSTLDIYLYLFGISATPMMKNIGSSDAMSPAERHVPRITPANACAMKTAASANSQSPASYLIADTFIITLLGMLELWDIYFS